MPQVSADTHVPIPPDARSGRPAWRFRPDGAGALAIHTISYAAGSAWLAQLAHEPAEWLLRHQAVRQVELLAEATRSRVRDA